MQFTLLQNWDDINADYHIRVIIRKDQWHKWYDEMMRRYTEREEPPAIGERLFDVDECQECGIISAEHLTECLKFLAK